MPLTVETAARKKGHKLPPTTYIVHYHDGRIRRKRLSSTRADEFASSPQVKEIHLEAPNDDSHKRPERPESPGGNPGVGENRPDRPESPGPAGNEHRPEPRPERPESPGEIREDEEPGPEAQPKTTPQETSTSTTTEDDTSAKKRVPAQNKQRKAPTKDK